MTKEKRGRGEFRSSTVSNVRRRIVPKTPLEENKSDERTVAVTTQESLDGIRGHAAVQEESPVQGDPRMTGIRRSMRL